MVAMYCYILVYPVSFSRIGSMYLYHVLYGALQYDFLYLGFCVVCQW